MLQIITFLLSIFSFLINSGIVYANPEISTSNVSASVVSGVFNAPNLISPPNNHASKSARFTFVWQRPTPDPIDLHHYDLYIDDSVYAASIPDSLTTQDYYFYTATASGNLFSVALKQDLTQGYHTWRVVVYDNYGTNASTGNWNFYIDSIAPFISLTKVESNTYNWNSSDPSTIPVESSRYLILKSSNPFIGGNVEANANLQISVMCPFPIPLGCQSQSFVINSPTGTWEKQLSNLYANVNYSVYLSATDATSNSTIFPIFYLKYSVTTTPTPTASITSSITPTTTLTPTSIYKPTATPTPFSSNITPTPSQEPLPTISAILTPPPDLSALITPTQYIPKPPPAPTLPPQKKASLQISSKLGYYVLIFFLLLGLPLHLTLASIAVGANLTNFISFLFTLGFPFLKRKNTNTLPFTFVEIFNPKNLSRKIYKTVSDINGNIYFPKFISPQVLVILSKVEYEWKNQLMPSMLLRMLCLTPSAKRLLGAKENLLRYIFGIRTIPLIAAILTSSIGMYFYPSSPIAIYLYLSLQYTFSEYAYPKIVSR